MFQELQIFDNSQIVGRGKISEIPQSTYCLDHNTENQKHHNMTLDLTDLVYLCRMAIIFETGIFHRSQHRWFLKRLSFVWQFSDCFLRKNIWDLTEHLSLVPKHWKYLNYLKYHRKLHKSHPYAQKCSILKNLNFSKTQEIENDQIATIMA